MVQNSIGCKEVGVVNSEWRDGQPQVGALQGVGTNRVTPGAFLVFGTRRLCANQAGQRGWWSRSGRSFVGKIPYPPPPWGGGVRGQKKQVGVPEIGLKFPNSL